MRSGPRTSRVMNAGRLLRDQLDSLGRKAAVSSILRVWQPCVGPGKSTPGVANTPALVREIPGHPIEDCVSSTRCSVHVSPLTSQTGRS
jgi:hypothetical protein